MTCLKRTHSSKIRNIVGVSALALLAAGCAANASGNNFKDKSGNFYTDNDFRGGFPNYGNNTASRTPGIDDARRAHRVYADAQAEEFDGYCEQVVTIERGETLSDIAEYCDVSVADLIEANTQIRNVHNIEIGQQVRIPDNTGSVYEGQIFSRATHRADDEDDFVNVNYVPRAGNQPFYVVRPGDTLSEISAETNVTYRTLASLNPGLRPRQLEVGQRIYLPASVGQTRRPVYYDEDPGFRPVVSISPARGPKNGKIQILAEGFERGTEVNVFIGRGQDDLTRLKIVETDGDGRINETVYLPDNYAHNEAVVALKPANYDGYVTSELYVVESVSQRNASTQGNTRAVHTVEDGQTLAWIASRYEVPMSALVDANPNIRWSTLSGGERIILPEGSVTATGRADTTPVMASLQDEIVPGDEITLQADNFPANTPVSIYAGPDIDSVILISRTRSGPQGTFDVDAEVPASIDGQTVVFVAAIEDGAQTVLSERVRVRGNAGYGSGSASGGGVSNAAMTNYEGAPALSPNRLERGIQRPVTGTQNQQSNRSGWFGRFNSAAEADQDRYAYNTVSPTGGIDSPGIVSIVGVLTDEGVKCPALRDDTGKMYSLLGDLEGYDDGDRILLRGSTNARDDICNQAKTVQVFEIESAPW